MIDLGTYINARPLSFSLHPELTCTLFSRSLVIRDGARSPSRGTCQRDARTKRFGTGSTKSAVPDGARATNNANF